jgi:Transposase
MLRRGRLGPAGLDSTGRTESGDHSRGHADRYHFTSSRRRARIQDRGEAGRVAVDIVHPRVAGIDVHKKVVWVAVRLPSEAPGERKVITKRFQTFWRALTKMAAWLAELGVTGAALESTGVYWWPVYHALAGAGIEVCVCNDLVLDL